MQVKPVSPPNGSELLVLNKDGRTLYVTRPQVAAILAFTGVRSRPFPNLLTEKTGQERFRAIQGGILVEFTLADFTAYLAGTATPDPVPFGRDLDVYSGTERFVGRQGTGVFASDIMQTLYVRGNGGSLTGLGGNFPGSGTIPPVTPTPTPTPTPTLTISGTQSTATVGGTTVFTPTIAGGTAPYTLSLASGTMAPGRGISGLSVTGTFTTAGTYSYTLRVTDSVGATATLAVGPLVVSAASALPSSVLLVAEGDSITTGLGGSGGITSYVDLAMTNNASQLPGFATGNTGSTNYTYRKVSQSGETALSMANGYSGAGGSTIIAAGAGPAGPGGGQGIGAGPSYDATKAMNIVSIHAGTNDNTISAEVQIYRALRSYQRQARATGFERSIGSTIISRTNATFNSTDNGVDHNFDGNTVPINLSIRQYWNSDLGYDYLCDFAADPAYDTAAHFVDKANDGTHPTDAGYARMGAIYLAGLQAVITQSTRTPRVQGLTFSKYDIGGNGVLSADLKTLTVTITGSTRSTVRGLPRMPVGSGKWYWEMVTNNPTQTQLGLCTEGFEPFIYAKNGDLYSATASGGQAIAMYGDTTAYNGTVLSGTYFPAAGDITQYCFDADTGLMWFRTKKASGGTFTNWNANASADPATLTGGIDIRTNKLGNVSISPAATIGNANATGITSRFASADHTLRYAGISAFRSFDTATVPG